MSTLDVLQNFTVMVAGGSDKSLWTPCLFVCVTKYVYVTLFLTFESRNGAVGVGTVGGVPVIPFDVMSVNNAWFFTASARVRNEPTARQTSYLRTC